MSEPFLAEIRIVSFQFPPRGWALCNGQLLPINQNQAIFALLGTFYGGDGRVSFGLPDMRGRTLVHANGLSANLGQRGGEESHTLSVVEMPIHSHSIGLADAKGVPGYSPGVYLSKDPYEPRFVNQSTAVNTMASQSISNVGGGQAHNNMQPYTTLNFIIALQGIFPSPN